jgi:hypothetical protein
LRRVAVLVLVLVALAPSAVRASAWYRCAHDGVVRAACCCPPRAKHHGADGPGTELRAACCCTITQVAARESSVRSAPPITVELAPMPALPVMIAIAAPREAPVQVATRELARAPRGPPAPLFVRHCALLL